MFVRVLVLLGVFGLRVSGWLPDKDDYTPMRVGDAFTATVQQNGKGWIDFGLRDGDWRSVMTIYGTAAEGLWYSSMSGCVNYTYEGCVYSQVKPEPKHDFPSGPLVFAVERRPSELAVWLLDDPGHVAVMPVKDSAEGQGRLRVQVALAPVAGVRTEFAVLQRPSKNQDSRPQSTERPKA